MWFLACALAVWTASRGVDAVVQALRAGPAPPHVRSFNALLDRFESLRGVVPTDRVVGYATALPASSEALTGRSFVLLYALAPAVIDTSDRRRFVVADFFTETALAAYLDRSGGVLRAHPDVGLGLVERAGIEP